MRFLLLFICLPLFAIGQENSEETVYDYIENEPEFPGGERAMYDFILKNTRYPAIAKENGEQGTVYVQFVVNQSGEITNVEVLKGVSESLDAEAKRVTECMPNWVPGTLNNNPVSVRYTLPFVFKMGDTKKKDLPLTKKEQKKLKKEQKKADKEKKKQLKNKI